MNNTNMIDKDKSVTYDPHIVPAETAARIEREGEAFKNIPDNDPTTGGYTVDVEGLINNFAVEPEAYPAGSKSPYQEKS